MSPSVWTRKNSWTQVLADRDFPGQVMWWPGKTQGPVCNMILMISLLYGCVFVSTVLTQDVPHIFAMTLFEEYIYWTDWETKSINRCHKTQGTNKTMLISTLHRPMDVHIYHPYRQPEGMSKSTVTTS